MPEEQESQEKKPKRVAIKISPKIILFLIVLAAVIGATIFVIRENPELLGLSKGQAAVAAELDKLVTDVGKLIALPSDEKPTVATVSDIEKLKEQPFFKNAQNGDKVLIYTNAKKTILYRPSENKIVEVGALNINQTNQQGEADNTNNAKIAVFNGTKKVGLSKTYSDKVTKVVKNAEITERANAARNDYSETIIVDLTGNKGQAADQIANALKITKSNLPDGEEKPENADFLIIVGSDKVDNSPAPTPAP